MLFIAIRLGFVLPDSQRLTVINVTPIIFENSSCVKNDFLRMALILSEKLTKHILHYIVFKLYQYIFNNSTNIYHKNNILIIHCIHIAK